MIKIRDRLSLAEIMNNDNFQNVDRNLKVFYSYLHLELSIKNGMISWFNTNDANIKNPILRQFQAVLREFKYVSRKSMLKKVCMPINYNVA